jgi:hypothetical protein
MPKVLLSTVLVICSCFLDAAELDTQHQGLIISTEPSSVARRVFFGPDRDMPISGEFLISMEPTIKGGEVVIPSSTGEALDELKRALPHWYLASLLTSTGEDECFVSINRRYITFVVTAWIQVKWMLEDPNTSLHKELKSYGAETPPAMAQLIHGGLCQYLKSDKKSALDAMKNPD